MAGAKIKSMSKPRNALQTEGKSAWMLLSTLAFFFSSSSLPCLRFFLNKLFGSFGVRRVYCTIGIAIVFVIGQNKKVTERELIEKKVCRI